MVVILVFGAGLEKGRVSNEVFSSVATILFDPCGTVGALRSSV